MEVIFFYIGIFIVFSSHIYSLIFPKIPIMSMEHHCYINIIAALFISYYFIKHNKKLL